MMEKKIAIVVGHTNLNPGACGISIPCEYDYNKCVADYLCDIADIYTYDSYNLGYKSMVKRNADKMNKKNYSLILELHYNAASQLANGTEAFYYFTNNEGKRLATEWCEKICNTFKTTNRGAKAMISDKQRGFWALYYPKATTLLLEPFFGSNPMDANKFRDKEREYAETIREFLKEQKLI